MVDLERVTLFPIRHHSPAGARAVRDYIVGRRPAAVLIEAPADFEPYLGELRRPHRLPIAIYSYVQRENGERLNAFFPLCVYSPEWQALLAAEVVGCEVGLIDMPWRQQVGIELGREEEEAGFGEEMWPYLERLGKEMGVETQDDLWDRLFEIEPDLGAEAYLERAKMFFGHVRATGNYIRRLDRAREGFMAERIREMVARVAGEVVVVVGGLHWSGLVGLLKGEVEAEVVADDGESLVAGGVTLTPYSYERMDSGRGYGSGVPQPGFYDGVWRARARGEGVVHEG
ncbi:MAG TPA: DUF5682 family protein, partial [Anaerolineae bacterium]|nr:DUF5682 family protein [Anaerolineae bacterium]